MQKELLKVALIGVGSVGKKYARMITAGEVPHMKLSAVVIRRDELIEWGESLVNTDGDNARIFRSAEELFETGESCYDAVIIATPHKTHKELALKALQREKQCYVTSRLRQILARHLQCRRLPVKVAEYME